MESQIEMEGGGVFFPQVLREACNHSKVQSLEVVKSRADLYKNNTGFTQMLVTRVFRFFWLKMCLQPELYTEFSSVDLAD